MRKASLWLLSLVLGCEPQPYLSPSQTAQAPPAPSAFVHFLVGSSASPSLTLALRDQPPTEVARQSVSPRLLLPAGEYALSLLGAGDTLLSSALRLLPDSETLLVAHHGVDSGGWSPFGPRAARPIFERAFLGRRKSVRRGSSHPAHTRARTFGAWSRDRDW